MWDRPQVALGVVWALWGLQALWCWYNVNLFLRRTRKQGIRQDDKPLEVYTPPAAVIVPVKGADDRFDEHIAALTGQDYPGYRVLFVVEGEADPAYAQLTRWKASRPTDGVRVDVVVAGLAEGEGQKVHNQLRALEALEPGDEVVVFADADAVPDGKWLGRLVWRLRRPKVAATTGYRWLVPTDGRLASRLGSAMNAQVATLLGPDRRNHAWGGSMAMRRQTLEAADLVGHWRGALSDDYQFTRAARRTKGRLYFQMRCLVASPAAFSWARLFEFGRRQHLITRVYAPGVWLIGLIGTSLYLAGLVTAVAAAVGPWRGWGWGVGALAVVMVADRFRGGRREAVVREIFDASVARRIEPALRLERWATPLVMAVHWLIIVSSAWGRTVRWSGVTYRVRGRQRVQIIARATPEAPVESC